MTVRDALREGAAALQGIRGRALGGSETPFLDASLLLADSLGMDAARLHASGPDEVGEAQLARYRIALASRGRGLPVAYILGYKEFWGRRFSVDARVLIPRPDTETLVEAALKLGDAILREKEEKRKANTEKREEDRGRGGVDGEGDYPESLSAPSANGLGDLRVCPSSPFSLRVHDVCTGSGCVAVTLAAERPAWRLSASDLSAEALEVASANALALLGAGLGAARAGGSLGLASGDLLDPAPPELDLITANPPYVSSSETTELLDRGWSEPRMALDGGADGLELVRRLVPESFARLAPGGALLVEADGEEAVEIAELFRASRFTDIQTLCDLGGRPRVTSGRKPWTT